MPRLIVATGNPGKVKELQDYFQDDWQNPGQSQTRVDAASAPSPDPSSQSSQKPDQDLSQIWQLALKPAELDIEETGETFLANARLKASQVAAALGEWAIADDSGLAVAALAGAPGLYSARYGPDDAARIARLLAELAAWPEPIDRRAEFVCALAVAGPDGSIVAEAEGICPGQITLVPQGTGGFGYDPVFYVPEVGLTFAEMPPGQKRALGHRGRAFAQLLPQLGRLVPGSIAQP